MKKLLNKKVIWTLILGGILALSGVAALVLLPRSSTAQAGETGAEEDEVVVESVSDVDTIQPKQGLATYIEVKEPADVEAFFRADLDALVPGTLKYMPKSIGDRVSRGEVLAEIEAPDRIQAVAEKEAVIEQRQMELEMAKAQAEIAKASINAALAKVEEQKTEQTVALAEVALAKDIWTRFIGLARDKVVTEDLPVEKEKAYKVAEAGVVRAVVAIQRAKEELAGARAKLGAAKTDIKLKRTLIGVARKDRDLAQALLDYAKITAPFDGIIIRRNMDPGDFVQNAATAHTQPILSVVRTDIITVVMKLPDTYAPYVNRDTEAIIHLPGRLIQAKVTRFSPSIHERDRTMRIEVDLYNGTWAEYQVFLARRYGAYLASLAGVNGLQSMNFLAAGRSTWERTLKGVSDPLPTFPSDARGAEESLLPQLLPRMYGTMQLLLKNFHKAYLIPSKAVYSRGGKMSIVVVENGRAVIKPIKVQMNDGRLAKITVLNRRILDGGEVEIPQELTGKEQIAITDQAEIQDGQPIRAKPVKNWPRKLKVLRGAK